MVIAYAPSFCSYYFSRNAIIIKKFTNHLCEKLKQKICYLSCSCNIYTCFSILIWFKNASHLRNITITYEETFRITSIWIHFQYVNIRLELSSAGTLPSTIELLLRCIFFSLVFVLFIILIASLWIVKIQRCETPAASVYFFLITAI